MKIVVTTPTGHIGNKLANILLDRKSDVTLIARHPEKVNDIAEIAAEFLLNPIDGHHIVDIVGPQEISLDEWARIAGQAIGKQVRVVTIPGDKLKAAMSQAGMSSEMAALLVEMEEAFPQIQGQFKGDQKRTGKVTFLQFAREVFAPAYKQAVQAAA